jgi:hypothetical protein
MKKSPYLASMITAATLLLSSTWPITSAFAQAGAPAQDGPVYGAELQGYDYPYPVSYFKFYSQRLLAQQFIERNPVVHGDSLSTIVQVH